MINNLKHNYIKIDYKNILDSYSHGIFPMAENIDSLDVFWVKPKKRGVIDPYRINIDRGCYFLGKLSSVCLSDENDSRIFITN